LEPPFLYGDFELTLDLEKHRLIIPSEIRNQIVPENDGDAFVVTARGRALLFFPEKYYKRLANVQIPPNMTPTPNMRDLAELKFALAKKVPWDVQGRMVLPEKLLRRTGLGKEVTLTGMRDHLELWDRQEWNAREDWLYREAESIENRAAEARQKSVEKP
jgi:transcriptional regulator MraZ